jgi:hypothetical protein
MRSDSSILPEPFSMPNDARRRLPTERSSRVFGSSWLAPALVLAAFATGCSTDASAPRAGVIRARYDGGPDGGGPICTRCGGCEEDVPVTSAAHVSGNIVYPDPPPAGGPHNPCWATWGVHAEVVRPENWVHNLEHGGIVFLYDCPGDCPEEAADLAALTSAVQGLKQFALMTPYPGLPKRFAVVSWGHRLESDCIDVKAALDFYREHANQAPESISANPDVSCL